MQPYIKAMAWGFWRERRLHIACCIAIAGAFSVFMSEWYAQFERYESVNLLMMFAMLIEAFGLGGFIVLGCATPSMRFDIPAQLSTKPVSSHMLVGIYLGLTIFSVVVLHLVITLLYRAIGHVDWPILVPLIGLITFVLCAYAAYWSLSGAPVLLVLVWIAIYGLLFCWCRGLLSGDKASWTYILRYALPYFVLIGTSAAVISVFAVKRARCGERLSSAPFWKRIIAWFPPRVPGKNWALKSPEKAYFWVLWRTRGMGLPIINALGVGCALAMCLCLPEVDVKAEVPEFMTAFAALNLFLLPFLGMLLMAHQGNKTIGLSCTVATRPLSNRRILGTTLKSFLLSYAGGWLVYGVGLVLICICFLITGLWEMPAALFNELKANVSLGGPTVLIYALYFWAAIGLAGSLALTGRKWPILILCAILFVVPNIVVFAQFIGGDMSKQLILGSLTWLFALSCILGSLGAFLRAYQRRLLAPLLVGCLILGYLICCTAFTSINLFHIKGPTETALLWGVLALPFAPFATAPLALHWNRHR
jgi:hypothetical protein